MNFLEAREANKTHRVRPVDGILWIEVGMMEATTFFPEEITSDWVADDKPEVVEFTAEFPKFYGHDQSWHQGILIKDLVMTDLTGRRWKVRCEEIK